MSDPTDAEWEAAEDDRLESDIWDHYRQQELEQEERQADRLARIVLVVFIVLLFVTVLWAAQTELG